MKNPHWQSPGFGDKEVLHPRALAWLNNELWVGYYAGELYKYTSLDTPGVAMKDSAGIHIPVDVYALLVWRDKLFIGGFYPECPIVHDPKAKTWKYVNSNYCRDNAGDRWICRGARTYELAATHDTLYAATGSTLLKIGYPDIP
jgi:hypothetical protein